MIGLNSKDLNESLSQTLGVEGKKEKGFFKEFKTQDRRQIRTKKWHLIVYLYPCAGYNILQNENSARLSLDFACSVKHVIILGSTINVLNWL